MLEFRKNVTELD